MVSFVLNDVFGHFMISNQLPKRNHYWSERYSNELLSSKNAREERLRREENKRRSYTPKFQPLSVMSFTDCEQEIVPIPYDDLAFGPRSCICSTCNKQVVNLSAINICDLCPSISHLSCSESYSTCAFTKQHFHRFCESYKRRIKRFEEDGTSIWFCHFCSKEILHEIEKDSRRLHMDRMNERMFLAATKLQSIVMMHDCRSKYHKIRKYFLRFQARCRGYLARKLFLNDIMSLHRVFRIKGCSYEFHTKNHADDKFHVSCIICILSNNTDRNENERQIYRFDSSNCHNGKMNDTFLIYCNSNVSISLTFLQKEHGSGPYRSDFLGQYVINAFSTLQHCFITGKPVRLTGNLERPKKLPRGQILSIKDPKENTYGRLSFDILPFSNIESKCGILEEILNAVLHGAKKKYFAVFAEKTLYLYSQYGDTRPKASITLSFGSRVEWFDSARKIIKISTENKNCWLLSCPNHQHLNAWYNKLTGSYKNIFHHEVAQFQGRNIYE